MSEWSETTLGALYTEPTERKVPEPSDQRYVGLEHIDPDSPSVSRWAEATSATSLSKVFRTDDVLFGRLRPYLHKVARADFDGVCTGEIFVLRATDAVLPKFLYLLAASDRVLARAVEVSAGTRMPRVSASDLAAIPVALPSLPTQERIVEVIGAVDDQIAALDGEAEAGATARAALLTDLLAGADETWTKTTIGDVVTFANGYAFPPKYQGGVEGTPFLKVSDMNTPGNEVTMSAANNRVNDDVLAQMRAKVHPAGTVVFAKVGAALLTEKRRVLGQPSAFDNNVMGLIATENVLPMFLYNVMLTVRLGDLAQQGAVPSVNQSHLRSVKVNLPPEATQERIVDVLSTFDNRIAATRAEAERLRAVRASLLSSLLTPPGEPGHISVEMIEKEAVGG